MLLQYYGTTTIYINPKNDNQYYLDFLKSYFLNVLISTIICYNIYVFPNEKQIKTQSILAQ